MDFKKNEIDVDIDNIEIGFVCKKNENLNGFKCLRKIVFARNTDYMCVPNNCVISVNGKTGDILYKDGMDLCNKIEDKKIIYPVLIRQEDVTSDNDIFIFDPLNTGCVLRFIGFDERLNSKDLKIIKRILLEPDFSIIRRKTEVNYLDFQMIDFSKIRKTMDGIMKFKSLGNTSDVTVEEIKSFKQKIKLKGANIS